MPPGQTSGWPDPGWPLRLAPPVGPPERAIRAGPTAEQPGPDGSRVCGPDRGVGRATLLRAGSVPDREGTGPSGTLTGWEPWPRSTVEGGGWHSRRAADFLELDDGWPGVREGLRAGGVDPVVVAWDDPSVDWDTFDLIVAVYTWGYVLRRDEFLEWADRTSAVAPLANSAGLLRWNTDKTYLADLDAAGLPIVPTTWVRPGEPWDPPSTDYVIKPTVASGGFEAARYRTSDRAVADHHVLRLHRDGKTVMVQPYQRSVDAAGETALVYLGHRYSHAVNKAALLDADAGVTPALWTRRFSPLSSHHRTSATWPRCDRWRGPSVVVRDRGSPFLFRVDASTVGRPISPNPAGPQASRGGSPADRASASHQVLELHGDVSQLLVADVLQRMGGQGVAPHARAHRRRRGRLASVEDHVAVGIAPDEVADAEDVEDTGPAVGMDGDGFSGADVGVQYSHVLVLEEQRCDGQVPRSWRRVRPARARVLRRVLIPNPPPLASGIVVA